LGHELGGGWASRTCSKQAETDDPEERDPHRFGWAGAHGLRPGPYHTERSSISQAWSRACQAMRRAA
jgi:hypothetical protein